MFRELDDESVLLNLHDESYYTLNQSGTFLWNQFTKGGSLNKVYLIFREHYQLEEKQAKVDLNEIVHEFIEKKFATLEPIMHEDA